MSRRRPNNDDQDALELFLDAMSNMFGGVVFIAVTVVVLLQFTVRIGPDGPVAPDASAPRPAEAEAVRLEITNLESLLDAAATSTADHESSQQYAALRKTQRAAQQQLDALRTESNHQQKQLRTARFTADELQRKRAQRLTELLDARVTLRDARRQPPQRLRVPRFRPSTKQEVPMLLSGNRLVAVYQPGPDGPTGHLNRSDFTLDRNTQTLRPRLGRGVAVDAITASHTLAQAFAHLDPDRHFVALAVWPDSFDTAETARDVLIGLGFEYGLHFIPADAGIPFNATSGVQ